MQVAPYGWIIRSRRIVLGAVAGALVVTVAAGVDLAVVVDVAATVVGAVADADLVEVTADLVDAVAVTVALGDEVEVATAEDVGVADPILGLGASCRPTVAKRKSLFDFSSWFMTMFICALNVPCRRLQHM